jgi:predicted NAD/FAD-dependent oxidoreductase
MLVNAMPIHDVIVLGAGVAGLQCARRLVRAGADVLVVDRADKPGGRCATRTFDGQPADYGPLFVHGSDPGFLAAVSAAGGERREGWPARVSGRGMPCQPDAFAVFQTRTAFAEGVNAFPRALAAGLSIRLNALAASVGMEETSIVVTLAGGDRLTARNLVLSMALEQTAPFVRMLGEAEGARSALGVLEMFASIPCLTLIAGYDPTVPIPDWEVCYPEDEPALLLMSNESSKRSPRSSVAFGPAPSSRILVFQASASWSAKRIGQAKEEWSRELLGIVSRRLGPWAGTPRWTHPHRWRYGRLDRANELAGPLELRVGASRIGIAGDLFSPGGGLQAAWLSGDRLGTRLAEQAAGA